MAAQGKSTGLTVGLIIAVVVALIAMVAAFLFYRQNSQERLSYQTGQNEKESVKVQNETLRQELEAVKAVLGITVSEVGLGDEADGTVLGDAKAKIDARKTNQGETNFVQVVDNLDEQLTAEKVKAGQQAIEIANLRNQLAAVEGKYNKVAQQDADAKRAAVADRADVQSQADERVRSEQERRQEIEDQLAATKAELEETKEQAANRIAALTEENEDYRVTNQRLTLELAAITQKTFGKPDGKIVNVQRGTDTVYLNLGSADELRPGVTFSVYDKDTVGPNGGDAGDVKGSIEVLSVDENVSEARITEVITLEPLSIG
ncbi:MAG: hypothetical protein AAF907_04550, partial [Planctomycetota bacterium]